MKKEKISGICQLTSLFLALILILSSCSPVKLSKTKSEHFESAFPSYVGDEFHKTNRSSFTSVCKSGLIELFFDEKTSAVGILDTSADVFWSSLPEESEQKNLPFAPLEIVLSDGSGNVYTLNSQDNSVYFKAFSYEKINNGVNVKYSLSLDEQNAKKDISSLPQGTARADITVSYTLSDGSFYASVSMNSVLLPKGIFLEKVKILNYFGSCSNAGNGDFIFVPDGIGAVIKTDTSDPDFTPVLLKVFGDDAAVNSGQMPALLGAFGIKHGKGAFLCLIESGESLAEITADRASDNSLNSVGAQFSVTDTAVKQTKAKQIKTVGYQYGGELKLCYRFLSGKSATYSGMAAACREKLIRNSVISSKSAEVPSSSVPLVVNLQFGYYDEKGRFTVKSTFEQAEALMTLLKAKGVNNVYLRAEGLFKNANNSESQYFGSFLKELGGTKKYNSLYSYMKTQNFPIFLDTAILSVSSGGAKNIYGKDITFKNSSEELNIPNKKREYLKMSDLEDRIEELLYISSDISFDGFALNDIGSSLYSDYSSDFYPRESSKKEISSLIPVLSSNKPLMIDTGNFYSIKNASVISSLPQGIISRKENGAYCAVPFIPLILHGTYDYCINSINLSENPTDTFLKTVEFGALPSSSWYCDNSNKDDKRGYDSNINEIVSYCIKANDLLADLRDARMTSHYEVQAGVYCTEYNNSTKIYVNYSNEPVTINGITVNSQDCVKIS